MSNFDGYRDSELDENEDEVNIKIDFKVLVHYKIKQFIKYGVAIESLKMPRFYKYIMKDYLGENWESIDGLILGEDDNMHFWISVPSDSEFKDENGNTLAGHMLAQKFRKEMSGMLLANATPEQVEYFENMDAMKAKVKYKIREEYWTKQKGENKIKMMNDIGRAMGDGFRL